MFEGIVEQRVVELTLYTDALLVRGSIRTHQHRVTDIVNHHAEPFLVLSEVSVEELSRPGQPARSEFAQINLDAVLFVVANDRVEPVPELRTPKVPEQALVSVPPFKIVGTIHLLPLGDLREGLTELTGRFLPVTDAAYWSDLAGEARQTATMVAINHHRAQILAPYREVDPWSGLDSPNPRLAHPGTSGNGGSGEPGRAGPDQSGEGDPAWRDMSA